MSTSHLAPRLATHLRNHAVGEPADRWARLLDTAVAADRSGVDKVVVSDHVLFGERLDEYARPEIGGVRGGLQPTGPDGHWLDPLTVLSFVAARTSRVRLASHVLLAALRRPVVLAKQLATLDVLSGGRLDVGVGVGWQREEYDAAGLDFNRRGELLDETLAACQTLWRDRSATLRIDGRLVEGIHQMPKPVQLGGVPIWVSGTVNRRVVERLVRFGSGWIPWGDAASDLEASVPLMQERVAAAGGDPRQLRIVGTLAQRRSGDGAPDVGATLAPVSRWCALGVTDFVVRVEPHPSISLEETFGPWVSGFRAVAAT